jgi:hypothetical protein
MTADERKRLQRIRDRRLLDAACIDPTGAPLRILLELLKIGDVNAWQEIGRRNGWIKDDSHEMGFPLKEELADRLRDEARFQGVPAHRLIETILADHLNSGKRVWA